MKKKSLINKLFQNDKFVFVFSLFAAMVIWVLVVVGVSPQASRVIKGVKVTIDTTVPSQFDLEVFGDSEFYVDVTVTGKKYQISNLTEKDIVVNAITNNVNSVGVQNLILKSEPANGSNDFTVSSLSQKSVDVYFDTLKTVQLVIEPKIDKNNMPIVSEGFAEGEIKLSETYVTVTGPSTEINKIDRVETHYVLKSPLVSNMSTETDIVLYDENNQSEFKYLELSSDKVVMTIPVFKVKKANSVVTFKNAPDNLVTTPLKYKINPASADFKVIVDEYDKTTEVSVGIIDFKNLYPGNDTFVFSSSETTALDDTVSEFEVSVDLEGYAQEYFTISSDKFTVNNPNKVNYKIPGLNKSVAIVGKENIIKEITEDMITVEVDLSSVTATKGQTVSVPAVVTVANPDCWVCGTYSVEVTIN